MYNIMLVDDDPIVLVELKKMIEWDVLGCELIAEAGSGKSAVELLKECKPDIIFTDISMPNMTGVELINYINEFDSNIKVVALSAYEDFNYVRGSLKNGAKDYLLKHQITKESINDLIKAMIQEIGEEKIEKLPSFTEESKGDLLYKIVYEYTDIENLDEILKNMKLSWLYEDMIVVIGGTDCYFGELHDIKTDELTMRMLIEETIKYYRDYFMMPLEPGIFVMAFSAREKSRKDIDEVIMQIQSTLFRFCGLELSFVVSDPFEGIKHIRKQIQIDKAVLLENYFQGGKKFIVHSEGIEEPAGVLDDENINQLNEILYLKEHNINEYFDYFFTDVIKRHLPRERIQVLYMEIIMFLKRKIINMHLDEKIIFNKEQPYEICISFSTCEDIKKYLINVCINMQKELKKSGFSFSKYSISEKAIKYIEINYKEKITLRKLADALLVSAAYLSRTFKKSTGVNLVTYINQIKMKHAREMILQGNLTLQEIADEIGIQNYNYFYILFKEVYGISPSDYIKSIDIERK
ncbi:response regulator [Anaerocolumna sedimenticola]|uniref:Stage 0 sporulation protein A homolog n=1 Tax=Anaerocolumna sedimenticola TaxID=2696063 RepID=A0A6P1TNY1_9FIRM|nr:response regulator [Anaerocolumna sedimenticola]QHQ61909.1 response regulator [Anaerocolumna sedimenticola]